MAMVVTIQAVALVLLGVLVVGLLRSHAEILRKLHELGAGVDPDGRAGVTSAVPAPVRRTAATAFDVSGTTPADEAVRIGVVGARQSTLLAFLSSGCATCGGFWDTFAAATDRLAVPGGARLVIITKGPEAESESRIRDLAPSAHPVVMSTEAWLEYKVPATPYFVYVDGPSGRILGEGSAQTWDQVTSLWSQALADANGGEARADRELLQAGIRPGHRSLYPTPKRED
jgi:hypothetical protein